MIRDHKPYFISNCNRLISKKHVFRFADFSALMDWSDEDLEELGRLDVEYSGIPVLYPESFPNQDEMSVEKRSRDFLDLIEYNSPEKKCSTSWVTAAIRAAEAALNYRVELSEKQLFECLPKDADYNDGCEGVHPKKLMQYLLEDGLVEKNAFTDCDSLDGLKKYYFTPNQPDPPTGSGLMNQLVEDEKPVFVMMAVDLRRIVFVKNMTNAREGVKCGGYQPSLYGVLTGYKYSENTQNGWWEVVANVIPGEEIVMKLPMNTNMSNANYAGIAAYAFTLSEVSEEPTQPPEPSEIPTSEIPTSEMPTLPEEPSYKIPLVPDKPTTPVPTEGDDDDEEEDIDSIESDNEDDMDHLGDDDIDPEGW